jgi:hypothetical protein
VKADYNRRRSFATLHPDFGFLCTGFFFDSFIIIIIIIIIGQQMDERNENIGTSTRDDSIFSPELTGRPYSIAQQWLSIGSSCCCCCCVPK